MPKWPQVCGNMRALGPGDTVRVQFAIHMSASAPFCVALSTPRNPAEVGLPNRAQQDVEVALGLHWALPLCSLKTHLPQVKNLALCRFCLCTAATSGRGPTPHGYAASNRAASVHYDSVLVGRNSQMCGEPTLGRVPVIRIDNELMLTSRLGTSLRPPNETQLVQGCSDACIYAGALQRKTAWLPRGCCLVGPADCHVE